MNRPGIMQVSGLWTILKMPAGTALAKGNPFFGLCRQNENKRTRCLVAETADIHEPFRPGSRSLGRFFKVAPEDILVVHDDLDINPEPAKLKRGGSSARHNGLKDITSALGGQDYWRLRIGVGHPRNQNLKSPVIDYVLQRPRHEDQNLSMKPSSMACRHSFTVRRTVRQGHERIAHESLICLDNKKPLNYEMSGFFIRAIDQ